MSKSDLDSVGYLSNVLAAVTPVVARDDRYSPERRVHALALIERFHKEITVALRSPKSIGRRGLRLVVSDGCECSD